MMQISNRYCPFVSGPSNPPGLKGPQGDWKPKLPSEDEEPGEPGEREENGNNLFQEMVKSKQECSRKTWTTWS